MHFTDSNGEAIGAQVKIGVTRGQWRRQRLSSKAWQGKMKRIERTQTGLGKELGQVKRLWNCIDCTGALKPRLIQGLREGRRCVQMKARDGKRSPECYTEHSARWETSIREFRKVKERNSAATSYKEI